MSFDVSFNVGPAIAFIRELRQRVASIRVPVYEAVQGSIRENVRKIVSAEIARDPGPVVHPFIFISAKSQAWYFWAKREGQMPGQIWDDAGGQYNRTLVLETAWDVKVNVSANETFMSITNPATDYDGDAYAKAVYGPEAIPGHQNTGWGRDMDLAVERIADEVANGIMEALDKSLSNFEAAQ